MTNKIKPLGNRIVVQREDAKTTKGGILLPEKAQEKPRQGKILATGPGKTDEKGRIQPMDVKAGDQVLFSSYAGAEYKAGDANYLIMSEEDVLAILN